MKKMETKLRTGDWSRVSDWRLIYQQRYYESKPGWKTEWQQWLELLAAHLSGKSTVLEIGGGPTTGLSRRLRPFAQRLIGLDVDPVIRNNPFLDSAVVYDGTDFLGIDDDQIDVAIADWVNEHIINPAKHFQEVGRVLKPGGLYIFRTVNLYHYKALAAWLTPHWAQVPLVRWLRHTAPEHYDAYKTYYRANTRGRIEVLCRQASLAPVSYEVIESIPAYGRGARPLFFLFMAYERLVNLSPAFEPLRHTIQCVARKTV